MTDYQSENCVGMPCKMATSFVKSILTARHSLGSISVSKGEIIFPVRENPFPSEKIPSIRVHVPDHEGKNGNAYIF